MKKIVLLVLVSALLLPLILWPPFTTQVASQTTNITSVDPFPETGKFYTLAGRAVIWEIVDEKNITSYEEDFLKWSVDDVVGDVAFVNWSYGYSYINPETGANYTDTYDFDYQIATNRTILSAYFKWMSFDTTGFLGSGELLFDEDVGEHTWAWFPTDLYIGAHVLVSWTTDNRFLDDMLYEVVDDEVIQVLGEKQDCWMVRMPPSITIDGAKVRTETYWIDKDTGVPLKIYGTERALDASSGWESEGVLVNTNIDLGLESTQPPSPTYTLTVPTTPGFPEAGKLYTFYRREEGWYMSDTTNVTYYYEGLFSWWVVNVTDDEALVYKILWGNYICEAEGIRELEYVEIWYTVYHIGITTREIVEVISSFYYNVNMTSLTYDGPYDLISELAGDIGEETYCWLPTNLYLGAYVNITWTMDRPWKLDNATYTVVDEEIISALGEQQASWVLYLPPTSSIDGMWNYSENYYSDKDTGIPLRCMGEYWAVDGSEAYEWDHQLIDTNVDLGPQTYVFPVVVDDQAFYVVVVTSSIIPVETFDFSKEEKKISYNVTGTNGTLGFCNVTIPKDLLSASDEEWQVIVDDTQITDFVVTENATHTFLYFTHSHSAKLVRIIGTEVLEEEEKVPFWMQWWFWAIVAIVIVALAGATYFLKKRKPPTPTAPPPPTEDI